jgi:hypothetical protein
MTIIQDKEWVMFENEEDPSKTRKESGTEVERSEEKRQRRTFSPRRQALTASTGRRFTVASLTDGTGLVSMFVSEGVAAPGAAGEGEGGVGAEAASAPLDLLCSLTPCASDQKLKNDTTLSIRGWWERSEGNERGKDLQ